MIDLSVNMRSLTRVLPRLRRRQDKLLSSCVPAGLLALVGLLLLSSCNRSNEVGLNPGDLAPQFSLQDLSGRPVSISDFRGKTVLLNFWASWCAPCAEEMPGLQSLYASLKDKGFIVVAVAVDDQESAVKSFRDRVGITFPILIDKDGKVRDRYKVNGFPESFLLDNAGKLTLFPDPESSALSLRIIGPREWDGTSIRGRLRALL